ncbi:MAG: MFS transporter [Thermoplasmata archaeon]|nr:MAG: MFS transporter [Thermoplasmata archaeon]
MSTGRAPGGPQVGGALAGTDRRSILLVATVASFLTPFMGSAVNIALPSMGEELEMDAVLLTWVATAYLLAAAIFLVPFGRLSDLIGRKRVFLWGMVLVTVLNVFLGLSLSGGMVVVLRFLQGIGAAMIFGTGLALLTAVYPKEQRGFVLGINVMAVYVGLSLGPAGGGAITEFLGWRWVFFSIVPMGLLVIAITLWKVKGDLAGSEGERFDVKGTVLYSMSITLVLVGFSTLPERMGLALIAAGALTGLLFVFWGSWVKAPVLDMNLFRRNRVFAYSNLAALIHYSATFAIAFLLSLYLQYIRGMSPAEAGGVILVQPLMMAGFSPFTGRLSDVVEPRLVASVGMAITTAGLAAFVFLSPETDVWLIIWVLVIIGIGYALFSSPNTNAVMSSVPPKAYGVASGTVGTMRLLGQVFSMGIATVLFAVLIGRQQITPELHEEFMLAVNLAFGIFAVLGVLGVMASMARGSLRD